MRHLKALFTVWAAMAAAVLAADVWDTKPFMDWDTKDVEKLLTDSPWAGKATLTHAREGANLGPIDLTLIVSVRSAEPVRRALARQQLAAGLEAAPELEKNLATPYPRYAFAIARIPQFYQAQLPTSAQGALLNVKGKQVSAINAAVQLLDKEGKPYTPAARGPQPQASTGGQIALVAQRGGGLGGGLGGGRGFGNDNSGITATLILEFPKDEAVTPADGEVELTTIIGGYRIRKTFKLRDMLFKGALSF